MSRNKKKLKKNKYPTQNYEIEFTADAELDYHNRGTLLPFDIEKLLEEFIEESLILENFNILVITGKGQVVRPIVKRILSNHKKVKSFKQAGYFNGQEGAFEVILQN